MNSHGFLRGYMAKNMEFDKFIEVVSSAIRREFNYDVEVKESNVLYSIRVDNKYEVEASKTLITNLMAKGPYAVDKFIFETIVEKGVLIDKKRSQYIEYCFLEKLD